MITGTTDNTDSNTGSYAYDGSGNITAIGGLAFRYDLLNRLTSGQARNGQGGTPFQTVAFDAYGSITQMTTDGVTRPLPASTSTNRLNGIGVGYDAAGNLTAANVDGFNFAYTYDALNAMKFYQSQSESKVFSYDADGERLESFRCPANLCGPGEGNERITLRGLNGEVLRVYEGGPGNRPWVEDYVYADGRALARVKNEPGGPVTEYLHFDHLGSVRKVTDEASAQVEYHEYFPFGEEATSTAADDSSLKFTGHERDDGPGLKDELDFMHMRYCGPLLGRFLSVDLHRPPPSIPQGWNRYAYVRGNPIAYSDPTGLDTECNTIQTDDDGTEIVCSEEIEVVDAAEGPLSAEATPFEVGWEWLTGEGPREREFTDGSRFAEMLKQHTHIRSTVKQACSGSIKSSAQRPYRLAGVQGVPKYFRDYSTILTAGQSGNLAVTYLGSYNLKYALLGSTVYMTTTNTSTIASATRPPVLGYTKWWSNNIGNHVNDALSSGPMSETRQTFVFSEPCPE